MVVVEDGGRGMRLGVWFLGMWVLKVAVLYVVGDSPSPPSWKKRTVGVGLVVCH